MIMQIKKDFSFKYLEIFVYNTTYIPFSPIASLPIKVLEGTILKPHIQFYYHPFSGPELA